jgi:hypothetical protein
VNYGALGAIVILMGTFINKMRKEHRVERDEWRSTSKEQFCKIAELTEKHTAALEGLKSAINMMGQRN